MKRHIWVIAITIVCLLAGCGTGPKPITADIESPAFLKIQSALAERALIVGEAEGDGEAWPFELTATSYDRDSGVFQAQISWPTLDAIHLAEGVLSSVTLRFTEVDFVEEGYAILDCVYVAELAGDGSRLEGTWGECLGYAGTFYMIVD